MIICYTEIIPKIRINDLTRVATTGRYYYGFLEQLGEVISSQPLYNLEFVDLVEQVLTANGWSKEDLSIHSSIPPRTLHRYLTQSNTKREQVIHICLTLGLDLVSTFIFLMSKSYILNPRNYKDKKIMEFLLSNKQLGIKRLASYDEFLNKKVVQ